MPQTGKHEIESALLAMLVRHAAFTPLTTIISMGIIAQMARDAVGDRVAAIWLAVVVSGHAVRWPIFRHYLARADVPAPRRLRVATATNLASTLIHMSSLAAFPLLDGFERGVQSMIVLSTGIGSITMAAGYPPFALMHIAFGLVPLFSLWAWSSFVPGGGVIELFAAVNGALYMFNVYRTSVQTFGLFENQFLASRRIAAARDEAEKASSAKTRFLAAASHDLRQPIHALALFSASLSMRTLDERSAEVARHIQTVTGALAAQMDALLDISKLDAGLVAVRASELDLHALLERVCREFEPIAAEKGLVITLESSPGAITFADGALLERIVRNLLSNAIKYTDAGGVRVSARPEAGKLRLAVRDSGHGIPASEHERVFEEFYQLENPARDRAKGLGLGLAIVKRLADLQGIPIELESSPGQGASFTLLLPLHQAAQRAAPAPAHGPLRLANASILVVDDEEEVRAGMRVLLESHGCRVSLAASVAEALQAALRERPDVALVDLRLANGESGLAAIERLRAQFPGLPAIIVSGDTAADRLQIVRAAGLAMLSKPVLADVLLGAIAAAIPDR